ncbi:MAG TPA: MFS transporter [Gemmatimonadales bacterium]|nr:MFS transporter [Gemmatimonadales bacterium]
MTDQAADAAVEAATLRTVTLRLMPALFLLYIISFLDRVNLGFAALQMNRDLGFSATVFGFGSGIFFIGYSLCEVPSNLVLARMGARRWISRIMVSWGVLASAMMFVHTPTSFYIIRFLLGAAEAGFFPGIIYYLSLWYPGQTKCKAVARFMVAIPISGVVSGALAGPLLAMQGRGGLAGWQWLFLLEGLPAVLAGFLVLRYLPDGPADARWLAPEGRRWLETQLAEDRSRCLERGALSLSQALANPTVWQLTLIYFLSSCSVYAYSFFSPQIIKGVLGGSNTVAGLIAAAISFCTAGAMLYNASHADRHGNPILHLIVPALVSALGWVLVSWLESPIPALLALALIPLTLSGNGPFWMLPASFMTGRTAAGSFAFINTIGALGGFVGPNLLGLSKDTFGDYRAGQLALALCCMGAAGLTLRLKRARELAPMMVAAAPAATG